MASGLFHVLGFVLLGAYGSLPEIDGEFQIPSEIEFGIDDGEMFAAPEPPAPAPPTPPSATPTPDTRASESEGIAADAGRPRHDAGIRDAGVGDADTTDAAVTDGASEAGRDDGGPDEAGTEPLVATMDAGRPRSGLARATDGRSRQVEGAQLTLRIDFERIRGSTIEVATREFLASIRDFQAVLGGSGIEPVRDLEQFLMSSPDPTNRRKYVYIGRLAGQADYARERVAELAATRGRTAEWTTLYGYPAAPWHDADDVGRMLVLLDEKHFVLCRQADLGRVLGWLRQLAETADRPLADAPGLALGVADDEVVSFEAVNLTAYAQGPVREVTPETARLSIVAGATRDYDLALRANYDDAQAAELGTAYWNDLRSQTAAAPMTRLLGMAPVLNGLELQRDHSTVRANTGLSSPQVQAILGLVQMQMAQLYARWDRRQGPPAGPTPPAPPGP